ncbi:EpsG family protein [Bacillus sp. V59.32b]|uniref:EpsG family protein n=1 Tax=Bacillus sp. V59.32b TaxID=1758642 RepID=UPI000E3D0AC2|nr:EpsG family protein [Bacillus sp. V59.32b]RFU62720.1 EpsG family protein [Bacillus sp. V59.32b]
MWLHFFLILYILLLGLLLGTGKQNRIKQITYIILTFGLFFIIVAFRSENVGNDTSEYLRLFSSISLSGDITSFAWRYEIGYLYLNKLLSLIGSHPQIIIIVTSFIIIFGFARFFYKYSQIHWLSTYLFFTFGYYGATMNTIRLQLAIIVILFAYDYLRKRNLIKFILIVILASMFHRTALVFLLAWPITKLKFNFKTALTAIITSLILYIIFPIIFEVLLNIFPTYEYYLGSEYLNGEIRLASVLNMLVGISIILFGIFTGYHTQKREIDIGNFNVQSVNRTEVNDGQLMLLLLVAGVSITFISFNFNLLNRVGDYFLLFSCVYLPNSLKRLRDKNLVIVIVLIIVVLFCAYATTILIMRPEWNTIYPYNFFWEV